MMKNIPTKEALDVLIDQKIQHADDIAMLTVQSLQDQFGEEFSRNKVVRVSVSSRSSSANESGTQRRGSTSLYDSRVSVISKQCIKFGKDNTNSELNWLRLERLQSGSEGHGKTDKMYR